MFGPCTARLPRPMLMALIALPLLAGCGGGAGYPSLGRRAAEFAGVEGKALPTCPGQPCAEGQPARVTGSAAVIAPAPMPPIVPVPAAQAGLPERLAAQVVDARAAHARFAGKRTGAEAAVRAAAGAEPGSDGWAQATMLVSELEAARSITAGSLADLDRIAVDDRIAHAGDDPDDSHGRADPQAIRGALATVSAMVDEETAVLDALKSKINH